MYHLKPHPEYGVLVDEQGLMLPKADVLHLKSLIDAHLAKSALELEAIGRRTVEENHPRMLSQFNMEYFA